MIYLKALSAANYGERETPLLFQVKHASITENDNDFR